MAFTLPPLPYDFAALEPSIDARTMEIHHDKHHAGYVTNLNAALEKAPELQSRSLDDLLQHLDSVPESIRTAVRNNGGGHWNHSMFWEIMSPKGGGEPTGKLADAIKTVKGDGSSVMVEFTDPLCPFCTRLAPELDGLDNVTHYTFLLPYHGTETPLAIWCARDPREACGSVPTQPKQFRRERRVENKIKPRDSLRSRNSFFPF